MSSISIGSILPVGTIIHSMLTTAQFATQYGDNWVLADGRSVTGTLYASVTGNSIVPDMRGRFLRGKGSNNPDGDLTIGTYTADKNGPHVHQQTHVNTNNGAAVSSQRAGASWPGANGSVQTGIMGADTLDRYYFPISQDTLANSGNESAPKSITVNIFIRIN